MNSGENLIVLMLGGNLGNTSGIFKDATERLALQAGNILKISHIYVSEPWGLAGQPMFKNQAIIMSTRHSPHEILTITGDIEKKLGRQRTTVNGPREIDIDILLFGDRVIMEEDLQIPHPRLHLRNFNLVPLAEIAPEWKHPVSGSTILQLMNTCTDTLSVQQLPSDETE